MTVPSAAVIFGIAAGVAVILTVVVRRLAWQLQILAHPREDRWNRQAVALLGGVAVWGATLAVAGALGAFTSRLWPSIAAGTALLAVGLVDDYLSIKPSTKLTAQIGIASVLIVVALGNRTIDASLMSVFAAAAWFVAVTNAFNLLDNMDGLSAGIAAVTALAFAAIAGPAEADRYHYALALGGACIGFLVFNFPPASVFLGDAGSLFLGGSFAALTLGYTADKTGLLSTLAVPVLILLLPIFDTVFVSVSRRLSARPASRGGKDHPSHRLVALGFSERQTVLMLWGLAAAGGVAAWGINRGNLEAIGLGSLLLVALLLLTVQLARVAVYDGADYSLLREHRLTPLLLEVTYKRRLFEVLLDTLLISIAYYFAYALRFPDDFRQLYHDQFVMSLPVVVACQSACLFVAGVYRGIWRYVGIDDLMTYGAGVLLGWVTTVLALVYLWRFEGFSRSVFMIQAMVLFLSLIGSRLLFRWFGEVAATTRGDRDPVLLYGAGSGGLLVARELKANARFPFRPRAFLDDDPSKWHRRIGGLPVLGGAETLTEAIRRTGARAVVVTTRKLGGDVVGMLRAACRRENVVLVRFETSLEPLDDVEGPIQSKESEPVRRL